MTEGYFENFTIKTAPSASVEEIMGKLRNQVLIIDSRDSINVVKVKAIPIQGRGSL
jgi:hypothetical protein